MKQYSIYLIETGLPAAPPVFLPGSPCASFPLWGHYSFLDFAAANLLGWAEGAVQVVVDSRLRGLAEALAAHHAARAWPLHLVENGLPGLLPLLQADEAERVLVYPLSQVCIADPGTLLQRLARPGSEVSRLAVDHTALELYVVRRKTLVRLLKEAGSRAQAASPLSELTSRLLAGSFELIEEVPGLALYQNSLMQLYNANLWLVSRLGSRELAERIAHLNRSRLPNGDIRIEKGGTVRESFLSAGTVVEGHVEASVLFPGVVVRRGAVVAHSVVMSGNCIGAKAQVLRSLILPQQGDNGLANIGEEALIGQRQSTAANTRFPEQLRDGITVLGANPHVPRGCSIAAGCLVGAEVSLQQLREVKDMRKGSTIVCDTGQ